jgi:hypothetical protein
MKDAISSNPQAQEFINAKTAMGRLGMPDGVGGLFVFLCSETPSGSLGSGWR